MTERLQHVVQVLGQEVQHEPLRRGLSPGLRRLVSAPVRSGHRLPPDVRRAVAAPNVGREAVPATNGSADEPAKPGGEPAAQRFMLHLLAENLDYVLEALGPVS